jgi:hypothetical protein
MKDNAEISHGIVFFYFNHDVNSIFIELFVEGFQQVFPLLQGISNMRELIGMQERIDRFVNEIPNKEHILQLVKKLDLILKIVAEGNTYCVSLKDGRVACCDTCIDMGNTATISGRVAYFEDLFDGNLKLLQGIKMNYFTTDCPFRAQLVLESLFYLARPLPV